MLLGTEQLKDVEQDEEKLFGPAGFGEPRLQRQQRQYPFADSGLVDLPQLFKDYGDLNYAHVDDDGCGWLINSHSDLLESIQKQLGVIKKLVRPVSSAQQSSVSTASQQQSAGGNGDVKVSEAPKNASFARAKASEVASTEANDRSYGSVSSAEFGWYSSVSSQRCAAAECRRRR